jgi:hypothetical protein
MAEGGGEGGGDRGGARETTTSDVRVGWYARKGMYAGRRAVREGRSGWLRTTRHDRRDKIEGVRGETTHQDARRRGRAAATWGKERRGCAAASWGDGRSRDERRRCCEGSAEADARWWEMVGPGEARGGERRESRGRPVIVRAKDVRPIFFLHFIRFKSRDRENDGISSVG